MWHNRFDRAALDGSADVAPALGHHVAAFAFGDIYERPGLDLRCRQLVTLGVLTALGGCEAQLKVHVGAALTVGLSREEIAETILHASVHSGFPRTLNAICVAKDVSWNVAWPRSSAPPEPARADATGQSKRPHLGGPP